MSAFIGNVGLFWHFVTWAFSDAILLVLGGAMLHRTGSHALGVGLIVPDICCIVWFNWVSMIEV